MTDLYLKHHSRTVAYLRNRFKGMDAQDAEDAVQEAWGLLLRYGCRHDNIAAWLKLVARRELHKIHQRRGLLLDAHEDQDGEVDPRDPETVALLNSFKSLKSQQRFVLGHVLYGFEYREIAEKAGFTYAWVNRHAVEGRAALRELVNA